MTKQCLECKQEIALHSDGSFVLHADLSGGVCVGTNCESFEKGGMLIIGKTKIPVLKAWHDPDQSEIEEV